jgi:hypothetical protein
LAEREQFGKEETKKRKKKKKKEKRDLTLTGLLMEGLENYFRVARSTSKV